MEHIHSKGIIHDDLSVLNLAIGHNNHSRIYLFGNLKLIFSNIQIKPISFWVFFSSDFGYSEIHESMVNEKGEDRRQVDLKDLARLLIRLAQGRVTLNLDEVCDY